MTVKDGRPRPSRTKPESTQFDIKYASHSRAMEDGHPLDLTFDDGEKEENT